MDIKYYLQKNHLSDDPQAYAAHVINYGVVYSKDLISKMSKRGTSFSAAEIESVLRLLNQTVCEELAAGYAVRLPFAKLKLSVGGTFHGDSDLYDEKRHKLRVSVTPGDSLKTFLKDSRPRKVIKPVSTPLPKTFRDVNSGHRNSLITPNGMGELRGTGLKFKGSHPEQGVYFTSEDRSQVHKVANFDVTTDLRISFLIPDLPPSSSWQIEVRTAYGRHADIIRSGFLSYKLLTV